MKIRYYFIKQKINELYKKFDISSYPIDPLYTIEKIKNVKAISFDRFMIDFNLNIEQLLSITKSKEGCCFFNKKKNSYLILYNNNCSVNGRILWTIIHELGHIVCGHYNINNWGNYSEKDIYSFMEREANYFAGSFLAHPAILKTLHINSEYDIEVYCGLSKEASIIRYDNFIKYELNYPNSYTDVSVLQNFKDYISEKEYDYQLNQSYLNYFKVLGGI